MDSKIFNCVLVVLVFIDTSRIILAEEVPFSYENNRVVKLLAGIRTAKPTTAQPKEKFGSWNVSVSGPEFRSIISEVETLKRLIVQIKQMNEVNEIAEKCVSSIKRRHEYKAQRHWDKIMESLNNNFNTVESSNILRRITVEAYDGLRENVIPVVHFINYTRDFSGLHVLLEEMTEYGHVYGGTEVFLFARLIRTHCGTDSALYQELPRGIQYIDTHSVRLFNENNDGALFYKKKQYCRGRDCIDDEIFTFHIDVDNLPEDERLKATWTFEPTNTSEFSDDIKFYLRNEYGNGSYLYLTYFPGLSQAHKSVVSVKLVNNTEDAVRIRIEESHLVKRLIMGKPYTGSNTVKLSIMYTEDRFDKANDGNWVVIPMDVVRHDEFNKTIHDSTKCNFTPPTT